MKSSIYKAAILGALISVASLPALAHDREVTDGGIVHLTCNEQIRGTFQGFHMGQILVKTDNGTNIELPSMALFFGTDPQIHTDELQVGQPLCVNLPERTTMRVLGDNSVALTLGDYEGVAIIPQAVVGSWHMDNTVWSAER